MAKTGYGLFIFALIFPPLAFGAVEQWSLTLMETSTILAVSLLLLKKPAGKEACPFYKVPGIIPLILLLAYILIQAVPLPSVIVKFISPGTYALYRETTGITGPVSWITISINQKATLMEFFRITAYAAFYVLTIQLLSEKKVLKKTVALTVIFMALLSFLGIMQHILSNNRIFWVRELTWGGTPFGPYVNRNHYAGLMGMMFPVVLCLFLAYKPKFIYRSLRDNMSAIFDQQGTNIYILLGLSAILIATSMFLSVSRGGIISLSFSMIFIGIIITRRQKKTGILILLILILILYSVGWFGWNPIFERFDSIRDAHGDISGMRLQLWRDSINIIRDFPLTGTGFGTFINIYPKYRTLIDDRIAAHAHNDYLELLADGGIIAVLLSGWFLSAVIYRSYRAASHNRRDTYSQYLFIGSLGGMVYILIHSFVDFNLHIGANGLYFFFLAGLAVASANTNHGERKKVARPEKANSPLLKQAGVVAVIILIAGLIFNLGVLRAKTGFALIEAKKTGADIPADEAAEIRNIAYRSSVLDPLEARYHYALANMDWLLSDKTGALSRYRKSVRLNPTNGGYLQTLGLVMSDRKLYDAADRLLQSGIRFDRSNPARYRMYVLWLLSRNKKERSINYIKNAISLEPGKTKEYITIMVLNGFGDNEIQRAMPEKAEPYINFADYLNNTGRDYMAGELYRNALVYAVGEKEVSPSLFLNIYKYYRDKGLYGDALTAMKQAVLKFPGNAGIRLTAAAAYEKSGLLNQAIGEYREALIIAPHNRTAKKRLKELTGG